MSTDADAAGAEPVTQGTAVRCRYLMDDPGGASATDPRAAATGPSWLRFGFLLAIGEVIMLVLVVLHPGAAVGARSGRDHSAILGRRHPVRPP